MTEDVVVPGARDVRGTLSVPGADACVVACPPHPQHGGSRRDQRLRAVADALADRGVACLRFDYGDWDGGRGESRDVERAVAWTNERFSTGLFGYSFGATLALVVAPRVEVAAVSALAPTARLGEDLDAVAALDDIDVPLQVFYGVRDDVVEWEPVVERARELGATVEERSTDHFYVGQEGKVAERVADFLVPSL